MPTVSPPTKKIGGEYGEIRATIDVDKLNEYLVKHVPAIGRPVEVKQFKYGQSNPTYFLTDPTTGKKFVLRKKPSGKLISKTAHQVEREYTVLAAIHKYNQLPSTPPNKRVPVPEPIVLCQDVQVVGTPFYIMEFLEGRIFTDTKLFDVVDVEDRKECWLSAVRALANLGSISPHSVGLSTFGPSTPYFPRQIKSMSRVSDAQAVITDIDSHKPVGRIPCFNQLVEWYRQHLPDETIMGTRIVHGDYKMDNLVFHPTENRVIGILDWELCTLGSPLADLANLTQPWAIDALTLKIPPEIKPIINLNAFKNNPQAPLPVDVLEREYAQGTQQSYPIQGFLFAQSWMLFRLSVISQGIAARHARRQASSEVAYIHQTMFPLIAGLARQLLEDQGFKFVEAKL